MFKWIKDKFSKDNEKENSEDLIEENLEEISDENLIRNCFRELKKIFEKLSNLSYNNIEMKYLSMGMTHDYKIALEEGANIIRVGSKIFGKRMYKNVR